MSDPTQPEPVELMIPLSAVLPLIGYVHGRLKRAEDGHTDPSGVLNPWFLAAFDRLAVAAGYRTSVDMLSGSRRTGLAMMRNTAEQKRDYDSR